MRRHKVAVVTALVLIVLGVVILSGRRHVVVGSIYLNRGVRELAREMLVDDASWEGGNSSRDKRSVELLCRATAIYPRSAGAWRNLGLALIHHDKTEEAVSTLLVEHTLAPSNEVGDLLLGWALYHDGQEQAALEVWRRIRADRFFMGRGNSQFYAHEYEQAEEAYRIALAIQPNAAGVYYRLADLHSRWTCDSEKVRDMIAKALALDDTPSARRFYYQGWKLKLEQRYDEAIESLWAAIQLDPQEPLYWHTLGEAYLSAHDYELAQRAFEQVITLDPDSSWGYLYLGIAYDNQGDCQRAARYYGQAILKNPGYSNTYFYLGQCYVREGELMEAIAAFEKAAQLAPADRRYRNALADAYREIGQFDAAISEYRAVLQFDANDEHALQCLLELTGSSE